ncbi:MAG: glycine betaine ABC transporter substrate-binding protein [Acidimicrobiales bacterium]
MKTRSQLWRLFAVLIPFAFVAAACGSDDDSSGSDGGGSDSETVAGSLDLSGMSFTVGSKDFTEQIVLGQILVQALEAAGAEVNDQTNLGGTVQNRDALLAGDIDMYWEYNGTGWQVHLEQADPSFDSEQLTQDVRELDLQENDIQWIGRSPFNDTYGFATPPDVGPITLEEMAQMIKDDDSLTVCLESEFPTRDDGLVLFEDEYDVEVPESQIEVLDAGVIYQETASGNCDFGEIFTTDGRIAGLDLNLVEDPGVFILYNVSLTIPTDVYDQAPEAFDTLVDAILSPLDAATMTELNRKRDIEGEDAADIAAAYLADQGIA